MTLDDPDCLTYFRFLLLVRGQLYQKVRDRDLRETFRIGSLMGADDCSEIGLRSLNARCHSNQFLFIQSTQSFVTVTNV